MKILSEQTRWQSDLAVINYALFLLGVLLLFAGLFLLQISPHDGFASLTAGPMLLFFDFVIVFPLAIMWRTRKGD
ncbi:MAG: hypothetical protein ISR91_07240 [Candidatus Delongbacteria bacterium]|nr:hypothetical protein [Candidatus Delongbacteria bacterium]